MIRSRGNGATKVQKGQDSRRGFLDALVLDTPLLIVTLVLVTLVRTISLLYAIGAPHTIGIALTLLLLILIIFLKPQLFWPKNLGLVMVAVTAILLLLTLPSLTWVERLRTHEAADAVLAMTLTTALLAWGAITTNQALGRASHGRWTKRADEWQNSPFRPTGGVQRARIQWFLALLSSVSIAYYFSLASEVPLVGVLQGNFSLSLEDRADALAGLSMPSIMRYLLFWTRSTFLPILLGLLLLRHLSRRRSWPFLQLVLVGAIAVLFSGANTEKAPVAGIILALFLVWTMKRRMNIRAVPVMIAACIVALAFPFVMYVLFANAASASHPIEQAYTNLVNRVFLVPSRIAMIHFEVFPDQQPFLRGASIRGVNELLGLPHFPLASYLYQHAAPPELNFANNPYGNANASFISEMWANFGWWGVVVVSMLAGVALQAFELWLKNLSRTPLVVSAYATVVVATLTLVNVNITTVVLSGGYLAVIAILWASKAGMARQMTRSRPTRSIYKTWL